MLQKQVRSNKDPSEGRDEDIIAERDYQNCVQVDYSRFSVGVLQVVYRSFAGYLQVICSQESIPRLFQLFYAVSTKFPRFEKKKALPTDTRTDRP